MIKLGLSADEMLRLDALLVDAHEIRVTIQLLDLEHNYVADVSSKLLGGQVSIDADAQESTRALTLELMDPLHELNLDSDSPDDGSVYLNRMARVVYSVISLDQVDQFHIPIFTGPLSKPTRNGPILTVEALGKEKLAMGPVWKARVYKKGLKKTWVIDHILKNVAGERKLQTRDKPAKLPRKMTLNRETKAWEVAKNLAWSMGLVLFYDGRGVAQLRSKGNVTVYVFRDQGALLSEPQASYDSENLVNAVEVLGGKPKGAKKKITYRVVASRNHALSPWKLGRWGVPRFLPETINDDAIRSKAEARRVGKGHLNSMLLQSVEVAFDCLPIPYLEEHDLCRVSSQQFTGSFRLGKMTIPLTADGRSTVGYLRRVTPSRRSLKLRARARGRNR